MQWKHPIAYVFYHNNKNMVFLLLSLFVQFQSYNVGLLVSKTIQLDKTQVYIVSGHCCRIRELEWSLTFDKP